MSCPKSNSSAGWITYSLEHWATDCAAAPIFIALRTRKVTKPDSSRAIAASSHSLRMVRKRVTRPCYKRMQIARLRYGNARIFSNASVISGMDRQIYVGAALFAYVHEADGRCGPHLMTAFQSRTVPNAVPVRDWG